MSINGLLRQSVTIYPQGTRDKFNKLSWGSGVAVSARFQKTSKVITTVQNEREPIDGYVDVLGSVVVEIGDKLVYDAVNYKVMTVKEAIDGSGNVHHKTVLVQRWNV